MRAPSATLSPLRCAIPRTILFVFWFLGAERAERRISPVLHNRPCTESSSLCLRFLMLPRHFILRKTAVPPIQSLESIICYYARHACERVSAIRVRSHPLKWYNVSISSVPILLLLTRQSTITSISSQLNGVRELRIVDLLTEIHHD